MDLEDEEAESFGVAKIQEFTWKQLLDLDACTRCGRCQDQCPAHLTEKPLSPKKIVLDLKNHLYEQDKTAEEAPSLIGNVIQEDTLWACTTCRNCMEHCPVHVEHVDKIVDLRRYQVLMESKFPEELMEAFRGLEKNSNPWGLGFDARVEWAKELEVPIIALSQLSRAVEQRGDKRPLLSDLRESGAIEQDADMVTFLYRPEYYKQTEFNGLPTQGLAVFEIAKHRNGSISDILLKFVPHLTVFRDYTVQSQFTPPAEPPVDWSEPTHTDEPDF